MHHVWHRFPTLRILPKLRLPMLLLHGTHDAMVPCSHSEELSNAVASAGRADLITFAPLPGCDHLHAIHHPQVTNYPTLTRTNQHLPTYLLLSLAS